jgi:SPP1 gp7 family putative phage head morphogenesis protein
MATLPFRFDGKNEAARAAVDKYTRNYVWRISKQTRAAINLIVERSIREGIAPLDAARLIRQVVGLNASQANAVMNYRVELLADGVDLERAARQVARYADRLLRERAITIARTEVMGALNAGSQETWRQAREKGLLSANAVKEWMVTPDELLCEICAPLAGQRVPLDGTFSTGQTQPPAHPRCRCTAAAIEPM